ncbi:11510_t:CDS:2, partial [Ambispora leptoticha]
MVRELGSERRETVWSLSVVGVGNLRRAAPSTRGPEWTDQWWFGEKSNEGLQFVVGKNEQGFLVNEVKINFYGEKVLNSMPRVFKQLASDGHNLVIEE